MSWAREMLRFAGKRAAAQPREAAADDMNADEPRPPKPSHEYQPPITPSYDEPRDSRWMAQRQMSRRTATTASSPPGHRGGTELAKASLLDGHSNATRPRKGWRGR